jgi:type IV pilus assembly protein PilC
MNYSYVAYTEGKKMVKGKLTAIDEKAAIDMLITVGYHVISIKPETRLLPDLSRFLQSPVKKEALVLFSRQLALLLEAGVGIISALELLQAQTSDKTLKTVLAKVVDDLRAGRSFSAALAQHQYAFPQIYSRMIGVGEHTGALESVLRSLADHIEREMTAMGKLKQALMYPALVALMTVVVGVVMVFVLLPPVTEMFAALGGKLPITTRLLISGMTFVRDYGMYLIAGFVALLLLLYLFLRTPRGRYIRDSILLRIPMLGRLLHLTELARCCRNLSLLFRSGLPMTEVVKLTTQATGNAVIVEALKQVEYDMMRGRGLSAPMRQRKVFLPLMVEMTKVGEETGALDETLTVVAENFQIEADRRTQTLLGMIEPVMTILIGGAVGFLALSVFMPIYGALQLVK